MLRLVTDSSADLPKELIQKHEIEVVPLKVLVGGKEYTEGVDITPHEFYQRMFAASNLPKTSQPSPADFAQVFRRLSAEGDNILCLTISSKLSGTYQSACTGNEMVGNKAVVFDTLAGSLGHGLQVLRAAELAATGSLLDDIVKELEVFRADMTILILLDTLENIVKGGRLSQFQGSLAKVLNIKVLLEGVEGAVELKKKVRGRRRFLNQVIEIIGERRSDLAQRTFGITHVDNLEDANFLKDAILTEYKPKDVIINTMGSTMATYAGRNGMIVSF
ncbi:MAG: DegV family protein [bacterium]